MPCEYQTVSTFQHLLQTPPLKLTSDTGAETWAWLKPLLPVPSMLVKKISQQAWQGDGVTPFASRGNASQLTTEDLDLLSTAEINWIAIYSHLMLRLQELLHSAKALQNTCNYKWCWAKGTAIFLRKTDSSMTIRLRSIDNLTKLRLRECPEAWLEYPCS